MKFADLQEDGRIVKGVNTTADVGPNQTSIEANKLVGKVNKDGYPPELHSKARKNSKPNTLYNLGLAEQFLEDVYTPRKYLTQLEQACIEGGHELPENISNTGSKLRRGENKKRLRLGDPDWPELIDDVSKQENISHTGTATARRARKKNITPGDDDWFEHWFSLPYFMGKKKVSEWVCGKCNAEPCQCEQLNENPLVVGILRALASKGIKVGKDIIKGYLRNAPPGVQADQAADAIIKLGTGVGGIAHHVAKGKEKEKVDEKWSKKYKKSINCSNPKGFSQKAHCAGRKKNEDVTPGELNALERVVDKAFSQVGIDVEFTRHFLDRANDSRNGEPITVQELARLFSKEIRRWGKPIAQMGPDTEAVMKDLESDINIPFALRWNGKELEMIAKTVMRKKDFRTSNKEFPVEDANFPSYADIKRKQSQPKRPPNPAITDPDGKVRGFYPDPQDAKQRASNIMYKAGRGLSRFIKGDPDYDPFDQRDAEVQKHTLPTSPYKDGSQPPAKTDIEPSIFEPVDMEKIRAEIGARYGLSADDVLKYSKADQPLPSQIDPKLIPKGKKMPTDAQVLAYRKDHPPVFNTDGSVANENFADGKKKGKSRPGRVKRSGASCKGSVTSLRAKAKKYSGERAKMYHWCANMKSGKKKK